MADKPLQLVNGKVTQVEAKVVSTGAPDSGKVLALDSNGRIDVSTLPVGVGPDVLVAVASEAIGAGKYVNVWNNAGVINVRLADNSNSREAHGFLKAGVASAASATVYFEGPNEGLSGLTLGARYFLGTAGGVTATPPTSPGAQISQLVGVAVAATSINTDIEDQVVLA